MGYSELQQRQDALGRNRENHGRLATSSTQFLTVGVGTFESEDSVDFGVTFIEKPRPHYCTEVDLTDLRELMDIPEGDPVDLPNCSGGVVTWDVDDNGHYVGAWCAVTVFSAYLEPELQVTHHFDFIGVGLKVIPMDPDN